MTDISLKDYESMDETERAIVDREVREGKARVVYPVLSEPFELGETRDQRRKRLTWEHHLKIESGEIDKGPVVEDLEPAEDNRDLRDPMDLGDRLLHERRAWPDKTISKVFDVIASGEVPSWE